MQNNLLLVISNRMISHFYTDMLAAMRVHIHTCRTSYAQKYMHAD